MLQDGRSETAGDGRALQGVDETRCAAVVRICRSSFGFISGEHGGMNMSVAQPFRSLRGFAFAPACARGLAKSLSSQRAPAG